MTRRPLLTSGNLVIALLGLFALAGNAVSLPLFFGIDFLFGSIPALLALFWFGPRAALLVAVVGSSVTWLLWGQAYTAIILVAEIGFVSWLHQRALQRTRRPPKLAASDALYWLVLGIPLTLLFYHSVFQADWTLTWLIALKEAINGILNATVAGLILVATALFWKRQRSSTSYNRSLFNVLLIAILLPGLLLLMWQTLGLKQRLETELAQRAKLTGAAVANRLLSQADNLDVTDPLELEAALDGLSQALCEELAQDWGPGLSFSLKPWSDWQTSTERALHPTLVEGLWVRLPAPSQASEIAIWSNAEYQVRLPQPLSPIADQALIVSFSAAPLINDLQQQLLRLLLALLSLALFGIALATWLSSRLPPRLHQRTLQRLRQSEARLSTIFENAPIGIALIGQDRQPLMVNRALTQFLGHQDKHLKQMRFDDLTHHADRQEVLSELDALFKGQRSAYRMTNRYRHADGQLLWGELRVSLLPTSSDDQPMALAMIENVTDLHLARERQSAAEQGLKAYAEQLESLLALANRSSASLTTQTQALLQLACRSLELETAAVWQLGTDARCHLLCALPDDASSVQAPSPKLMAEASAEPGTPVLISDAMDAESSRAGERSVVIGMLINQLQDNDDLEPLLIRFQGTTLRQATAVGEQQFLRLIAQRIAALHLKHQLQEHLSKAREREAIGHLASGVSHDFNNLLGVIDANLFYLSSGLEDQAAADSEIGQVLAETHSALGQAKVIASGMLAISGSGPIPLERIDLGNAISDLKQILEQVLPPRIALRLDIEPGLRAFSNRAFLQSALLHLMMNARDAMSDQGTLTIAARRVQGAAASAPRIGVIPAQDCVEIAVIDTGKGIAPSVLERIFDPLFSTKAKQRGHGIGLFMVREFVLRTQAGLWIDANADQGTCFRLWLSAQPFPEPRRAQTLTGPRRLLLVEDDRRVRDSLRRLLKSEGIVVETAQDGQAALLRLAELGAAVDLVLSDIAMPVMDGLELSAHLTEQYPHLPFILMTGQQAHWEPPLNSHGEAVTILRKPIDLSDLKQAFHEALLQKRA
ncbi:MAG: PAS domain S-box protein [Lamprobacter sp.]|uniref:response regulator n=1 Tax=Lamprobacter sp. TaxID=3100796 RepID=UPI002B25DCDE|nr:response regulator [Lamprobacter sp.]MEA3639098.1 PAS domain S-box protein [Lamprobacter sp.]